MIGIIEVPGEGMRRNHWLLFFGFIGLILVTYGLTSPAAAAPPNVTLQVYPASISLYPGQTVEIALDFTNASSGKLSNLQLTAVPSAGFDVSLPSLKDIQIDRNNGASWSAKVTCKENVIPSGPLVFQLEYTWTSVNGDTQTNGVTAATLGIQVLQPQPLDKNVTLQVYPASISLYPGQTVEIALDFTNASSGKLSNLQLTAVPSAGFDVSLHPLKRHTDRPG